MSTRIRFHAKTETFRIVFAFRSHANAYSAFSKVSVFTENGDFRKRVWKWRLSKTGLKVETFENGLESGDFRKRVWKWRLSKTEIFENAVLSCGRAKTETFENGVDLKKHTCGRGLKMYDTKCGSILQEWLPVFELYHIWEINIWKFHIWWNGTFSYMKISDIEIHKNIIY